MFSVSPASPASGSLRGMETIAMSMEMTFWRTLSAVTVPLPNACSETTRSLQATDLIRHALAEGVSVFLHYYFFLCTSNIARACYVLIR